VYYEERVIDGVLHWRNTPDGEWTAYTAAQLTDRLIRLTAEVLSSVQALGVSG
jgi:hypothetical protein